MPDNQVSPYWVTYDHDYGTGWIALLGSLRTVFGRSTYRCLQNIGAPVLGVPITRILAYSGSFLGPLLVEILVWRFLIVLLHVGPIELAQPWKPRQGSWTSGSVTWMTGRMLSATTRHQQQHTLSRNGRSEGLLLSPWKPFGKQRKAATSKFCGDCISEVLVSMPGTWMGSRLQRKLSLRAVGSAQAAHRQAG